VQIASEHLQPWHERRRHLVEAQPEEILDLRARDQNRDPVREADDHGPGQVIDPTSWKNKRRE